MKLSEGSKTLVSIITINKNNRDGLQSTIESIAGQGYGPYEHIIVDSSSTDGSIGVIKDKTDDYCFPIRYISEKDSGIYNAMNKGVLMSSGKYLIFINSGDRLVPGILKCVCNELDGTDLIYGNIYLTSQGQQPLLHIYESPPFSVKDAICGRLNLPHPGTFINRELFSHRMYDEKLQIVSDWKFWIESIVFDRCSIRHIDKAISCFDMQGISSTHLNLVYTERRKTLNELFSPDVVNAINFFNEATKAPLYRIFLATLDDHSFQKFARLILKIPFTIKKMCKVIKKH